MNKNFFGLLLVAGLSFSSLFSGMMEQPVFEENVAVEGCCEPMPAPRCHAEKRNCCPAPRPVMTRQPRIKCCPVPRQRECVQRTSCSPRPVRRCPKIQRCMPRNVPVCQPARPCDTGCNTDVTCKTILQPINMSPVQACNVQQAAPRGLQPVNMSPVATGCATAARPTMQPVTMNPVRRGQRAPVSAQSYTRNAASQRPAVAQPEAPMNASDIQPMKYANSQDTQRYMQRGSAPADVVIEDVTMDFKE